MDRLMVADPKAIKHILHSAGYHYPKAMPEVYLSKIAAGNGIASAQGLWFVRLCMIEDYNSLIQLQAGLITVSGRL